MQLMSRRNTDLMVEHDGLVLVARLELVIPCRFYHVIWFAEQRHVQQLVVKPMLLCTSVVINVSK